MVINSNENNTALTEFLQSEQAIAVMEQVRDLKLEIETLQNQESAIRESLVNLMDQYGVKSFENDILRVTYKEASLREGIDLKKLRNENPDIYEKYKKFTPVKASVIIKVKEVK